MYFGPGGIRKYSNGNTNPDGSINGGSFGYNWFGDTGIYGAVVSTRSNSGVYSGSLSSQGRIVAEQLNNGDYLPVGTDPFIPTTQPYRPYLTGYFGQYWQDPTKTTFGSDTAIPALTGVLPVKYSQLAIPLSGSLLYYIDLSISRLLGGGRSLDIFYFVQTFNQIISYVTTTNDYIASVNQAEDTNFAYYGSNNYTDLITGNFDPITKSRAATTAISNIGKLIAAVPTGQFGTANAVAQTMIENGLGFVNNLYQDLTQQGINTENIYNPIFTPTITNSLSKITNPADLFLIQTVLETSVPKMTSPLDYTDISKASGIINDSEFKTMQELGQTLYEIAPNLTFVLGSTFASMLENIRTDGADQISSISSSSSLLNQDIINSIRSYLPQTADNQPITVLNVIGAASGYLTEQLKKVNDGLAALYATNYGPQIRSILESISRFNARVALSDQEINASNANPNYWTEQLANYQNQYKNLLATIASDKNDNIAYLVSLINDNYDFICQQIYFETINYAKGNFSNITAEQLQSQGVNTNTIVFDFVTILPFYGADSSNIKTDALLFGLAADNTAGSLVKSIIAQAKNNQLLGIAGVKIN